MRQGDPQTSIARKAGGDLNPQPLDYNLLVCRGTSLRYGQLGQVRIGFGDVIFAEFGTDFRDTVWSPPAECEGETRSLRLTRSPWNFGDDGPGVIVTQ